MIFAGVCKGEISVIDNVVSAEINQELLLPADDLTVTFVYGDDLPDFERIYVLSDDCEDIEYAVKVGDVLFSGIVDEQILTADTNFARVTVCARGLAALLIDNECRPSEYVNPTLDVIYIKHLAPFGITLSYFNNVRVKQGRMRIEKGSSHYKVLSDFCSEFLGTVPRIDCKGVCRADCFAGQEEIVFDNRCGVPFEYVQINNNRYSRISKVYVSRGGAFDIEEADPKAVDEGIVRERFLSLLNSKTGTLSDADRVIKNGREESFSVVLKSPTCLINKAGCRAKVNIEQCKGKELVVSAVHYKADGDGELSTVKLSLKQEG